MKGLAVFLAVLAVFSAPAAAQNPIEEILMDIINEVLSGLEDPMNVNDTILEWAGVDIILTAETRGIVVVGLSGLQATDVNVDLIGNFDFKIEAPGQTFAAAGGLNIYVDSSMVWPVPVFGDGEVYGELAGIEVTVTGQLMILPLPIHVRNFDYSFTVTSTLVQMESINDAAIIDHVNANGPQILADIDAANHATFQQLLEDEINEFLAGRGKESPKSLPIRIR